MTRTHLVVLGLAISGCTRSAGGEFEPHGTATAGSSSSGDISTSLVDPTEPGGSGDAATADAEPGLKFDVPQDRCPDAQAGWRCDGATAIECDAQGEEIGAHSCLPGTCVDGQGCAACVPGQVSCLADKVRVCDDTVVPAAWRVVEVCDAAAGEACDVELVACAPAEVIGGTEPTGVYFRYASFGPDDDVFIEGFDVGGRDDRLFVHRSREEVDIYRVSILDGDGDGVAEPDQHPDNPDHPGAIEPRVLMLEDSILVETSQTSLPTTAELQITDTGVVVGGHGLIDNPFVGAPAPLSALPPWLHNFEQLGYDDAAGVWYASHQRARAVYQRDPADDAWGLAFRYPALAGDHMDGLEVVADPSSGVPFVYVSDMTSDFLGQYRFDPEVGWVQENLFAYDGPTGAPVEGLGFGPLHHFWATGGGYLYEIGGGDLAAFTEPAG